MKMRRNCGKFLTITCLIVLMYLGYHWAVLFVEEGTITYDKLISSARYFQHGEWRLEQMLRGRVDTVIHGADFGDNDSDSSENENYFYNDKWGGWNETEKDKSTETDRGEKRSLSLQASVLNTRWLMYTKEPPTFKSFKFLARDDFRDQVNWTRCIFRDCTFRGHCGALVRRSPPDKDYDQIYAQKRYQVAWFVSHCDSQSLRDKYVKRMLSEIDFHIFGQCGNRKCGKQGLKLDLLGRQDPCLNQVSADYKFYLSFENSMCSDYVTEKFYKLYENINVIPVVRGGANYSELAPTGSYVNAKDFHSPEDLGKYLRQLSENKQEYIRMLKIKDGYINTFPKPPFPCELCKALHTRRHVPSTYTDILKWMKDHCWKPRDL